ncbi:DUF1461 domain-containing protein [Corallincola luteus]|uniref:DUF1461 domain-containing protein n=3 Tax=Psychromonadaceae TaxID=267894 RepID=A0A368NJK2_9GAMM|nr:DUF1461 domain-containing protein [Corallincola holothuriorum]TCI01948.1 DUF1461 domain-containing protein [Corallincola luteus]
MINPRARSKVKCSHFFNSGLCKAIRLDILRPSLIRSICVRNTPFMALVSRLRTIVLALSLFYATFYPALASVIYTPTSYQTACHFHGRCLARGVEWLDQRIDELVEYWRHDRYRLPRNWTIKERQHLKEVRAMYDQLVWGLPIALILLLAFANQKQMLAAARFNTLFVVSLLLLIPVFNPFWKEVFHPLLFDNLMWKNNRADTSWYFMPKTFFRVSTIYIICATTFVNLIIWQWLRISSRRRTE